MLTKLPKDCKMCGEIHQHLGSHVRQTHRIPLREYWRKHIRRACRQCHQLIPFRRELSVIGEFCSMRCAGLGRRGRAHPQNKGGHIDGQGYRRISIYAYEDKYWPILEPMRFKRKRNNQNLIFEHRIVMAIGLGRSLQDYETIHHINGKKLDNRLENLELRVGAHGIGVRARDIKCPHCGKSYV